MSAWLALSLLGLMGDPSGAASAAGPASSADQRLAFAKQAAGDYRFQMPAGGKKVQLHSRPLLRWNNRVVREDDAVLFLWTDENKGPPVAAAQFFLVDRQWHHEFQSLTADSFDADEPSGRWNWTPRQAGVRWQKADQAAAPGDSAVQRLRQMKSIAGQFTAAVDQHDEFESPEQLRLLATPLYRYEAAAGGVLDGALFAFVQGTNPEILMLVEAHQSAPSQTAWRYGFARMSCFSLRVYRDDATVWSELRSPVPVTDRSSPYFFRWAAQPDRSAEVVVRPTAAEPKAE